MNKMYTGIPFIYLTYNHAIGRSHPVVIALESELSKMIVQYIKMTDTDFNQFFFLKRHYILANFLTRFAKISTSVCGDGSVWYYHIRLRLRFHEAGFSNRYPLVVYCRCNALPMVRFHEREPVG